MKRSIEESKIAEQEYKMKVAKVQDEDLGKGLARLLEVTDA